MDKRLKVGVFVFSGLLIAAIVITILGKITVGGYKIKIVFNDISNLADDSPVKIAGVKVGHVSKIDVTPDGKAVVEVWIDDHYKIHEGCRARIISTGLIGTKYIQLTTGVLKKPLLKDGQTIEGISTVTIEEILESLRPAAGEEDFGITIRRVFDNLKSVTGKLDRGIKSEEDIEAIVKNLKKATEDLKRFTSYLSEDKIKELFDEFPEAVSSVKKAFEKFEEFVKQFDSSESALGTLLTDKEVAGEVKETLKNLKESTASAKKVLRRIEGFKTYWDYNLRYDRCDAKFRNDLGIKIAPRQDKFYYFGASNIQEKTSTYDKGGERIDSFDAYLGKGFGQVFVWGGLLRSSGGFGFSVFSRRKISLYSEFYRFDRKISGKTKPWIDVGMRIKFTNWLYGKAIYSDALDSRDFQIGLNLYYEDEDLPYLFGLGSLAATSTR
ncbi:MAG: hypothetical protein DRM99_05770 [Thermoplasmata archaeon]|nr:MAG: hypothetical protein DRM99_05770 [Thermoplasmata archaeon]